jgi:hypothetical protein
MSIPGAAQRHPEQEPAPDPAGLCARADAAIERLWALAEMMTSRPADVPLLTEAVAAGLHFEEMRAALHRFCESSAARGGDDAARDALVEIGRQMGLAQARQEQASRPRARHAKGSGRLRVVGGVPGAVKIGAVAAAAAVAATGTIAGMHDTSSVRPFALPSPAAVMHAGVFPPDTAVLVPSASPSRSRRASQDARSASPAPSPPVSAPVVTTAPPQPSPSPSQPALTVPPGIDLGSVTRGTLILRAGDQDVTWTLRTSDGITVTSDGGVLQAGQELDLTVFAPLGYGWIYVSAGSQTWTVEVTSDLAPAALPPLP